MNFKDAVIQNVPELHAVPIYWAVATLATSKRFEDMRADRGPNTDELHAEICDEVEGLLDDDAGLAAHPLTLAAAGIWRSVSAERQYAVCEDLLVQLDEGEE